MKASLTKPSCICLQCSVQSVFLLSSKCCIISRNSDRILEVHFLLSGSSCVAVADAVQSDVLEDKAWEKTAVCTCLKSPVLCVVPGQQAGILKS